MKFLTSTHECSPSSICIYVFSMSSGNRGVFASSAPLLLHTASKQFKKTSWCDAGARQCRAPGAYPTAKGKLSRLRLRSPSNHRWAFESESWCARVPRIKQQGYLKPWRFGPQRRRNCQLRPTPNRSPKPISQRHTKYEAVLCLPPWSHLTGYMVGR